MSCHATTWLDMTSARYLRDGSVAPCQVHSSTMQEIQSTEATAKPGSWALLHVGSPEAFVHELCAEARNHSAVRHVYLQRLASGRLPDIQGAIRDFCHQYHFYSRGFPNYLKAVISRLHSASHRDVVRKNLEEEEGWDPKNPANVPHTELFGRFRRAAGVDEDFENRNAVCATAKIWSELFLQKCQAPQSGVGLGAIGVATEMIVSQVYRYLYEAIVRHTKMTADDYLFLTLHMECDDQHAEALKAISIELAEDPCEREALRFGALAALELRQLFWDGMLARAMSR